ncbi:MAG TPA: class I SAM-dependent methyltransferase [Pyrinomonadaceae bacterium]|nr:class I SAM-dependent methyltransferase [Pyrinomonadaceae bacterium]
MTSYSGRHAELYDLFYADKPYGAEANFVHECLRQYGSQPVSRVLELACGTGSHSFVFEKLGYKMVATDYSPDMLAFARAKAARIDSTVEFKHQDMTLLDLAGERFDAAVCLFDSIGYVVTNENIKQVLSNLHRHLNDGALFVFEFWHAAAMISLYEPVRVRSWTTDVGQVVRVSETALNVSRQTADVTYIVYELRSDGTYSSFRETQTNRYFLLKEMEYFLSSCGFKLLKSFSGFKNDESITADTWHVVAVAQQIPREAEK